MRRKRHLYFPQFRTEICGYFFSTIVGAASKPETTSSFEISFADSREISLVGASVELHPVGLVSKRVFSKKYPIAIILSKEAMSELDADRAACGDNRISSPEKVGAQSTMRKRKNQNEVRQRYCQTFTYDLCNIG